jgi:hypothetical protein
MQAARSRRSARARATVLFPAPGTPTTKMTTGCPGTCSCLLISSRSSTGTVLVIHNDSRLRIGTVPLAVDHQDTNPRGNCALLLDVSTL